MKDIAVPIMTAGVVTLMLSLLVNNPPPMPVANAEPAVPTERELELRDLLTDMVAKLDDHTTRLMAIQDAIGEEQATQLIVPEVPADVPQVPDVPEEPVKLSRTLPDGFQLRIWTASWCKICDDWKRDELPKFAGDDVVEMDYDEHKAEGDRLWIKTLPTFQVMRPDGSSVLRIVGTRTAEQLRASVTKNARQVRVSQPVQRTQQIRRQPKIITDQWGRYRSDNTFHCGNGRCRMCNARRARRTNDWQASIQLGQEAAPQEQIDEAVRRLKLGPDSVLADIGCGDGRVLIRAAQATGCSGVGIEIDPRRAEAARRNAADHGLDGRITIVVADARTVDLEALGVSHVYTFLFSELLDELRPQLKSFPVAAVYHPIPGRTGELKNGVYLYSV